MDCFVMFTIFITHYITVKQFSIKIYIAIKKCLLMVDEIEI